MGVEINAKKNVDADEAEIQGAELHPDRHTLGVSVRRRVLVMAAVLSSLGRPWLQLGLVESLVGRLNYCLSFQPCIRSLLCQTYRWITRVRGSGAAGARVSKELREELFMAAILLPHASTNLDSPWCSRVERFDACPGGHGRAYGRLTGSEVASIARWPDAKVGVTSLSSPMVWMWTR